jgi:uncharacterized membrane protein
VIDLLDGLVFAKAAWLPLAILMWVAFTVATWFSYREAAGLRARWIGTLLRAIGLGILCFCLLEPTRSLTVAKSQANTIAVLVDNSRSMKALYTQDPSEEGRLVPSFAGMIADEASWLSELGAEYRVKKYLFGGQIQSVEQLSQWDGTEYQSNIEGAIVSLKERYPTEPLAGIVLITDGRSTQKAESLQSQGSLFKGIPIFPVLVPTQGDQKRDLWIQDVSVQTSDFETAPVTIVASIGHRGFPSERIDVQLEGLDQVVLQKQTIELDASGKPSVVRFQFRPKEIGPQGYKVECRSSREIPGREMTLENNHRYVAVDRTMGPYRILYLSGRPNWEYKFLQRALSQDAELALTALIRIAKRQPKFSFRSKGTEDSNPLFSGFEDVSEEEKEKYDEPVFARLGVLGKEELTKGFPKDASELYAYSMIILDDLETEFFSVDQMQLLRQFVSLRGGTLLMLGGQESMRGRGFRDSVLGQLLPVYGDPTEPEKFVPEIEQPSEGAIRYQLTREGWLLPYLRVQDNEADESKRLEQMPSFEVWNRTVEVKAGARILVEGPLQDGSKAPLLVVQKFGRGQTGAVLLGDLWRWAMMHRQESVSPFYQSWRQIVRGLMVDIPRRVEMTGRLDLVQNTKRLIEVTVRDEKYLAMDNASVEVRILPSEGGETIEVKGVASLESAGVYETSFLMRRSGVYRVEAEARSPEGNLVGQAQSAFVYEPEAIELADCSVDEDRLRDLAQSSGGTLIRSDSLDTLIAKIPVGRLQFTEQRTSPLWHTPWLLGMAVFCLAAEWWWRRRHGLA